MNQVPVFWFVILVVSNILETGVSLCRQTSSFNATNPLTVDFFKQQVVHELRFHMTAIEINLLS